METITITLDGVAVSGREGMTILELAREIDIQIPTLCDDPCLRPVGACRICLVEDERTGRLLASCVTPIGAGMQILTRSPAVLETRGAIVKLLIANHSESCVVCDKGNRCQLRQLAADLGIGYIDYDRMPSFVETQDLNPFIQRDLSKCILCAKCIRADQELVVVGALEYLHRGFPARPATFLEAPLEGSECTFCGTCTSMCPTGALTAKGTVHKGTLAQRVATTCAYCGCGCSLWVHAAEGRMIEVAPKGEGSANQATLCVRGHYGGDYLDHPDRLRHPMFRLDGELTPLAWGEALDRVASSLGEIAEKWGAASVGFFGSTQCTNEENYLFQKIARMGLGTPHVDNGARFHAISSIMGLKEVLGVGAATNPMEDLEGAEVILVIGAQPAESHPVASYRIKRAVRFKGARLVYAGPLKDTLSAMADPWLKVRPGGELAVILGILGALVERKTWREDLIGREPKGLAAVREAAKALDDATLERVAGVNREELERAAEALSGSRRCAIVFGAGITKSPGATAKVKALARLGLLLGCLGVSGGGIHPLDKAANTQGACDMGMLPEFLPGFRDVSDPMARAALGGLWGSEPPAGPGWSFCEMIEAARSGKLKALFVLGENPVALLPDVVADALRSLEFLVVQDLFFTETAQMAHAVLPGAGFLEKDGTFTSLERRIQRVRAALSPPGEARPDWWILSEIGNRLGVPAEYDGAADIMKEIAGVVAGYEGVKYSRLEGGGLFWPCPDEASSGETILHRGSAGDVGLGWNGEGADPAGPGVEADSDHPWIAVAGETHFHFMSGTRSSRARRLREAFPRCRVLLNPRDMEEIGLSDGQSARMTSRSGRLSAEVRGAREVPSGVAWVVPGPQGGAMGRLTAWQWDPVSKMPQLFAAAVRIEREGDGR